MLLAVDVGNSETVIGLFEDKPDGDLVDHWRVSTLAERTSDEVALLVQEFLAFHGFSFDTDIAGVAVCSGVPRVTAALRDMTEKYFGFAAVVLEAGVKTGMPILYDNPKEVAADRIANAVGALELYDAPLIVVDFSSTATIFDAISAKGEYLGGTIFPGVEVSLDALVGRAAMLRRVELVEPRSVIGRSVVESIQAGIVYGTVDAVDGIVNRFKKELGDCTVVATGGLAGLVGPLSSTIEHHEPWLTLHGLRTIFEKNRP
ncbi:MAG TPA: type III pantothenate kinase [Acidimicrobiales bacterium]|nr:type III pantothenate kinase [Acidimicrobiales bacterium]